MKNKSLIILLITLLSIIVIVLTIFMINMLNGNFNIKNLNFFTNVSNELVVDEVYDNTFNKIDIRANAGDIYIKESLNNEVKVIVYGDKNRTSVSVGDNELLIESKIKSCVGICFNRKMAKIELYLPSDNEGSIEIKNNYGDIDIDSFKNMDINIDEDCGNIEISNANKVDIKQSAGDIEIGEVTDIIVKNNLGDTKIEKVNNYLNIKSDCGDVEIDSVNLQKDSYIKNDLGDIEIGSTNEIFINASTDLGSLEIKNNFNKAETTLKIENDCGDIEVNN